MPICLGGWRVWVDTLAIAHSKISLEKAREAIRQKQQSAETENTPEAQQLSEQRGSESRVKNTRKQKPSSNAPYRTPEFVWSRIHIRLLDDLLSCIERVVESWCK